MKVYKTTNCEKDGKQTKILLPAIPINAEYTICLEESNIISEVYEICGIKNGSVQHKVLIEVDDINNRFNRPSLHMAVYYVNTETNEADVYVVTTASVFESSRYAIAQKILTLLKEHE